MAYTATDGRFLSPLHPDRQNKAAVLPVRPQEVVTRIPPLAGHFVTCAVNDQ